MKKKNVIIDPVYIKVIIRRYYKQLCDQKNEMLSEMTKNNVTAKLTQEETKNCVIKEIDSII